MYISERLSIPTNRTVTGPNFKNNDKQVIIEYDYERDDGGIIWAQVIFDDVLSFEYRQSVCCCEEDMVGSKEIRCQTQSERLLGVVKYWQKNIGWQEWLLPSKF